MTGVAATWDEDIPNGIRMRSSNDGFTMEIRPGEFVRLVMLGFWAVATAYLGWKTLQPGEQNEVGSLLSYARLVFWLTMTIWAMQVIVGKTVVAANRAQLAVTHLPWGIWSRKQVAIEEVQRVSIESMRYDRQGDAPAVCKVESGRRIYRVSFVTATGKSPVVAYYGLDEEIANYVYLCLDRNVLALREQAR